MSASYALLGILGKQPSYGYDLKRDYDSFYGKEKPLAFGQVYATLSRLLRDKKIKEQTVEQNGGPERKKYIITPLGRHDLEKWLGRPELAGASKESILFTKVVSAILLDKAPNDYLDAQRAAHLEHMRELTEIRRKGDLAQMLRADYKIFQLEAELRWIDVTSSRLETLKKELLREQ